MRIIRNGESTSKKTAVALGNFDGIHQAHSAVIKDCINYAKENGAQSCVFLFCNHTQSRISNNEIGLLTDEGEKIEIIENLGADSVYFSEFSESIREMTPEEFVQMLVNKLNICAVCVGYDYHFGYNAAGDVTTLKNLGEKYGFCVRVTDEIKICGKPVKSTDIRKMIAEGDVFGAKEFLARPYTVCGKVVQGLQNGRKIGIPTANIDCAKNKLLPKNGVYMGYTVIDGIKYKSVINVGNNPTLSAKKITVESHILGFDEDIYTKTIKAEFVKRIRDDIKFNNLNELKEQIHRDIEMAINEL